MDFTTDTHESQPLASVNGRGIYKEDVDLLVAQFARRGQNLDNEQGRAMLLEQVISQRLFLAEALSDLFEREPAFKEELRKAREQLLVQYGIGKVLDRVKVTPAEVEAFYKEHADQFTAQPMVSASHILVDNEVLAASLMKRIQAGEITFEDAAREYSSCPSKEQGGSLGEFGRGQMVPEFDEACFSMEVGELRGPIKTRFGYHVIRLDDKKESEPMSFDDVKDELTQHLAEQKQQEAYSSKLRQLQIRFPVDRY